MVKEQYKCPYCGNMLDNYDDAIDCARNCVMLGAIISHYKCEICGKSYGDNNEAVKCEQKHIQNKDKDYLEYERKESFKRLEKASKHPGQKTLMNPERRKT